MQIWPIQMFINELPPLVRYVHVIVNSTLINYRINIAEGVRTICYFQDCGAPQRNLHLSHF